MLLAIALPVVAGLAAEPELPPRRAEGPLEVRTVTPLLDEGEKLWSLESVVWRKRGIGSGESVVWRRRHACRSRVD